MIWKKYFKKEYLKKGLKLYHDNKVHNIKCHPDIITSTVNDDYHVKIIINEDKIESVDCVCLRTQLDYCEHIVATLYKYEDILENIRRILNYDVSNPDVEFKNTLDNMDDKTLKKYIHKKFKEDDEFIEEFLDKFKAKPTENDFEKYENMLNNIFNTDFLKSNYDNLCNNGVLNIVLYDFIEKLEELLENKQYDYAYELISIIYEKVALVEDIDKYCDIQDILFECDSCLCVIIENQDNKQKDKTYNSLMKNLRDNYNIYTSQNIVTTCLLYYTSKKYQENMLDVINNVILENEDIPLDLIQTKVKLMSNLDYSYKNIKKEVFEYREDYLIHKMLVKAGLRDKKYEEVICLLEDASKEAGCLNITENTVMLIDLYKEVGNKKKLEEKLRDMLYDFKIGKIEYVKLLEKLTNEDKWKEELNYIIELYKTERKLEFVYEIYIYYHRYEDLYNNIIDEGQRDIFDKYNLDTIEEYRQYYQEEHSNDILNIYEEIILEEQKTARSRLAYDRIIDYLNTMLTYPGGREWVLELIHTMKNDKINKGKKVFLEELDKFEHDLDNIKE